MIEEIRKIGEKISEDFKNISEVKRKESILESLEVRPKSNETKEIKLIFDLDKKEADIKVGDYEFREEDKTFCFDVAGNDPSPFFGTNNIDYHVKGTIPNLLKKIPEEKEEFKEFIKKINREFYLEIKIKDDKKGFKNKPLLDISKFILAKLKKLEDEKGKLLENKKSVNKVEGDIGKIKEINDLFLRAKNKEVLEKKEYNKLTEFIKKDYLGDLIENYKSSDFNINKIYFKEEGRIKDISETEFWEEYINICYNKKIGDFFSEKGIKGKKIDFLTNNLGIVTNNVSFKTKFYTTTNGIYFENIDNKNAHKSFTVSQETFEELLLGSDYIFKKMKLNSFQLSYLIIPRSDNFIENLKENRKIIIEEIKNISERGKKGQQKDIDEKKIIQKYSSRISWKFDLMFYEKDQSAFNVYKIISDLSYYNIEKISKTIEKINNQIEDIKKHVFQKNYYDFNLNSIWNAYYSWTKNSGAKDKRKLYRSEMLDLLDSIYTLRKQNQKKIFRRIMYNLRKNYYYRDKNDSKKPWNAFQNEDKVNKIVLETVNYLNFLLELNMMDNSKSEQERKLFTKDISNEDLKEYFDKNSKIFNMDIENGIEKQGLVILGYFVNKIIFGQVQKHKKNNPSSKGPSKTFIDKINFDGIKKEDLYKKFVNDVMEYMNLYKREIYEEPKLFAEMQERLGNIKQSSLSKEEIVYYILLGNFLGKYIGIKRGTQKASKENETESNKNSADVEKLEEEDGN